MKRFLLALCGGLLLIVPGFAQLGGFSQRGRATQQMKTDGLRAAHNNIPLDSTVKVINTVTGKEIEVTVTGRIPASPNRIIDLSPAAWEALGLSSDTIIMLVYSPSSVSPPAITPLEPPAAPPEPTVPEPTVPEPTVPELIVLEPLDPEPTVPECEDEPEPAPSPILAAGIKIVPALPNPNSNKIYRLQVGAYTMRAAADKTERRLRNAGFDAAQETHGLLYRVLAEGIHAADVITAANALAAAGFKEIWVREDTRPCRPENEPPADCYEDEYRMDPEAELALETEDDTEAGLALETEDDPEAAFVPEPKPRPILAMGIKIIPALPNPNTNKIYRLQVGAYAVWVAADKIERKLRATGFETCRETHGLLYRILVVGVRAADVIPVANALKAAGFTEIWIREQKGSRE